MPPPLLASLGPQTSPLGTWFVFLANGADVNPCLSVLWGLQEERLEVWVQLSLPTQPSPLGTLKQERSGMQSMTPQYRKGKLSLRGAGFIRLVTLGGGVGRPPKALPPAASCGRWSDGSGPRRA